MASIRESSVGGTSKPLRVDRQRGILFDVKVLGERGNCDYPRATRERAIKLMEGKRVYLDHGPRPEGRRAPQERSYRDAFGVIEGVYERGDGLYAKRLRFNPRHPQAEQLAWDSENAPHLVGMSIVGDADKRREGGRDVVEAITRLDSCDLVTTPAHGGGLFESKRGKTMLVTVKKLRETLQRKGRIKQARLLREAAESGAMTDTDPMEVEPDVMDADEATGNNDADAAVLQALGTAWTAIFSDDSLDDAAVLKKAKDILGIRAKLTGSASSTGSGEYDAGAEESRRHNLLAGMRGRGVREARGGDPAVAERQRQERLRQLRTTR